MRHGTAGSIIVVPTKEGLVVFFQDITERKLAEKKQKFLIRN
jgi:hypothetical protein